MNQRSRAVIEASLQRAGIALPGRPTVVRYDTNSSAIDRPPPRVGAAKDRPTFFISSDAREAFRLVDFDDREMGGGLFDALDFLAKGERAPTPGVEDMLCGDGSSRSAREGHYDERREGGE
jgi:hypothetical protein